MKSFPSRALCFAIAVLSVAVQAHTQVPAQTPAQPAALTFKQLTEDTKITRRSPSAIPTPRRG